MRTPRGSGSASKIRRGFRRGDIEYLCDLMVDVIKGRRKPGEVREDVIALRREFDKIEYGFQSVEEALKHIQRLL
ncbi:MAG: serine hydroxymethyltransferase [Candidatus Bathyarchaeota archaeon B26-1]|nr:MAG: serine hydroxymethyltransferase [Candidatus Bathyarchaeota archaeon B26-1]